MSNAFLLAIDQGTTSTRAMVFEPSGNARSRATRIIADLPKPGRVEHDPDVIWRDTEAIRREAVKTAGIDVAQCCIGITNSGRRQFYGPADGEVPVQRYRLADRRTGAICARLKEQIEPARCQDWSVARSYFSATKIAWLLDNLDGARDRAEAGELTCGPSTVFSFGG